MKEKSAAQYSRHRKNDATRTKRDGIEIHGRVERFMNMMLWLSIGSSVSSFEGRIKFHT